MTSKMYGIQTSAYNTANEYQPPVTNSTPDHPPVHEVNLEAACAAKKKVLENLPKKCGHCRTPLNAPNCIMELKKTGDIMAYCRGQGGCGRSQVLFVGVNTSIPRYRKVCVFKAVKPNQPEDQQAELYAFQGTERPEIICERCGQQYRDHPRGYDHNGWLVDGYDQLELPADWPIFCDGKFVPYGKH